ncbi:MAG: phosphoribosylglycinamide formyltransferase [Actinomycetaceae bacterium]|nr:phosphoribosylglycinamide formyltransferase [Actinomycetaceae bacterium]
MKHTINNRPARLVVLVSGGGSNMVALHRACQSDGYGATIVAVGADRPCKGLDYAHKAGIPVFMESVKNYDTRQQWDKALTAQVAHYQPDLVICAGFLKLLGNDFVTRFSGRIINTHNSLLPSFPGIHGPADALAYGVKYSGATLFFVDPGVDTGLIIAQTVVPVRDNDTPDSLLERIKVHERKQLVESVGAMVVNGWTIQGRRVSLNVDATGDNSCTGSVG